MVHFFSLTLDWNAQQPPWMYRLKQKTSGAEESESKGSYLSCACNHCWVMYSDCNFFLFFFLIGRLLRLQGKLVTRWWISFTILACWSNKPKVDIGICHSALDPYRLLLLISQTLHLLVIIVSTAEAPRDSQGNKLLQHNCKEVLLSTSWVRRKKHMGKAKKSMTVFEQLNPVGPCMLIDYLCIPSPTGGN